jgi:hypothetical protein
LWFAWQIASPQAAEHMQAGIEADKQRQFTVAIKEFKQVTELDPSFAMASSASARLTWRTAITGPRSRRSSMRWN